MRILRHLDSEASVRCPFFDRRAELARPQGLRISLNVWFSREPNASEDTRLLQRPFSWGTTAQRLWGLGPQEAWPPGGSGGKMAEGG